MSRKQLVAQLEQLTPSAKVVDLADGWPGLVNVTLDSGPLLTAAHVGPVGLSHRDRDDVERRFQNPGKGRPMSAPRGSLPLLLGLWQNQQATVVVGMDAEHRLNKLTRQSLFIPLWLLEEAQRTGWAEHHSTTGELIVGFHPALLATYVELRRSSLTLPQELMAEIAQAAGLADGAPEDAGDRARRASMALVRSRAFARDVSAAYQGICALCGLDLELTEAAHIYPARAPGSPDKVWNGVALCRNHHAAFDRCILWIDPDSRSVCFHPEAKKHAEVHEQTKAFIETTRRRLGEPQQKSERPRKSMFEKRYSFLKARYDWL